MAWREILKGGAGGLHKLQNHHKNLAYFSYSLRYIPFLAYQKAKSR